MATDTVVVMEPEGNGFNDTCAESDSNSTLDEPIAVVGSYLSISDFFWDGALVSGLPSSTYRTYHFCNFFTPSLINHFMHPIIILIIVIVCGIVTMRKYKQNSGAGTGTLINVNVIAESALRWWAQLLCPEILTDF